MADLATVYRSYRDRGFAAIPLEDRGKRPRVLWQEFQQRMPTDDEIETWARQWPNANVAMVMGHGRFVIDVDGHLGHALEALVAHRFDFNVGGVGGAVVQRTGRGHHLLLATDRPVRNAAAWIKGDDFSIDVRGDGGYIVVAPSVHANGVAYEWETPFHEPPIAPAALLDALTRRDDPVPAAPAGGLYAPVQQPTWVSDMLRDGSPEGKRNNDGARLAGYLFVALPEDIARTMMHVWGERSTPPMDPREVEGICKSISRKAVFQKHATIVDPDALQADIAQKATGRSAGAILAGLLGTVRDRADMLPTPYPRLNQLLYGGILGHEYTILAARPSVGKTAMAIEMAEHAARLGRRVLFVSIEMSPDAVAERMAVRLSGLDAGVIRAGGLNDDQHAALVQAAAEITKLPIIIEGGLQRADQIHAVVEQAASEGEGYGLVIVDYLQLMQPTIARKDARRLEIDDASQILKSISKNLRIPVVAICALARRHSNDEPTIAELKESGGLEYQADNVILLHRAQFAMQVDVIIGKARGAQVGRFSLYFDGRRQRFSEDPGTSFGGAVTGELESPF